MTESMLPPTASPTEHALSSAGARMLALDVQAIRRNRQPMQCSAAFLPLLCWERSLRRFDPADSYFNRARAQNAFVEHELAGTPAMLETEISFDLGYPVTIRDFFEAGLAWPGFEALVTLDPTRDPPDSGSVLTSVMARKNVRDWPALRYQAPAAGNVFGAACAVGGLIQILPDDPNPRALGGAVFGAALWVHGDVQVEPMQ
ncbi:phage tail P2-like protein [Rhodoblastus sphagnicola]|nr:phage tail protein [Rhodoblastus sphagnicola]MBB4199051.1 phage tail P2-like protein [Rhodoblastus sphagnicola]